MYSYWCLAANRLCSSTTIQSRGTAWAGPVVRPKDHSGFGLGKNQTNGRLHGGPSPPIMGRPSDGAVSAPAGAQG
jgi:hypothetical protein